MGSYLWCARGERKNKRNRETNDLHVRLVDRLLLKVRTWSQTRVRLWFSTAMQQQQNLYTVSTRNNEPEGSHRPPFSRRLVQDWPRRVAPALVPDQQPLVLQPAPQLPGRAASPSPRTAPYGRGGPASVPETRRLAARPRDGPRANGPPGSDSFRARPPPFSSRPPQTPIGHARSGTAALLRAARVQLPVDPPRL